MTYRTTAKTASKIRQIRRWKVLPASQIIAMARSGELYKGI
jgi:hypothetical protein